LGGAIPPFLAVRAEGLPARRLTLANLLVRGSGAMAVLIFAAPLADLLAHWVPDPAAFVAAAHLGFSAVLLVVFLPLLGPVTRLAAILLPDRAKGGEGAQTYLDEGLMSSPDMAIAVAARETLRMGDVIGSMLDQTM